MEPTTKMTKEEKLKAIKKYLKDNWVEILIYFILLGGFVMLAMTNLILKVEKDKDGDNGFATDAQLQKWINGINYPIYFLTGLNLLFTPHKLYGTAKQPIKNICIKIHRKRKKIGVITER